MTYSNILESVRSAQLASQNNTNARVKNLERWADFSTSANELLGKYTEQVAKNDEAEGYNDFIENGLSDEEAEAYNKEKASIDEESDQITALGIEFQQQGINRDLHSALKDKSRAYKLGAAKALAQRGGEVYPSFLQSALADTTKQYRSPTGETFTIGTATPAEFRYATALIRKQFLERSGLMYINKGLVNELGVRKILLDTDHAAITSQKRRYDINESEKSEQEILSELYSGGDYNRAFDRLKLGLNPETGLPNSYSDVMGIMEQYIRMLAETGDIEKINAIKATIIPEGSPGAGKTLGEFRAPWFRKIELDARQAQNAIYNADEAVRKQQHTELSRSYIDTALASGEVTGELIEEWQLEIQALGLGRSRALDQLGATLNVDGLNDEADVERLGNLAMSGKITMEDLKGVSWKVWQQFYPHVQRLQQKPEISKAQTEAIKDLKAEAAIALGITADGPKGINAGLLENELTTRFYNRLNELKVGNPDVDEKVLINKALVDIQDQLKAGKTNPTSNLYIDQGGVPNLRNKVRNNPQLSNASVETQRIRQLVQSKGKAALQDPSLYGMTAQQIEDIDPTNLPQIIIDVGTLFGEHPAYVYNEALKGIGSSKPPLNVPQLTKTSIHLTNPKRATPRSLLTAYLGQNDNISIAQLGKQLHDLNNMSPVEFPQDIYIPSSGMMHVNNVKSTTVGGYPLHTANIPTNAQALLNAILGGEGGWDSLNPGIVDRRISKVTAAEAWRIAMSYTSGTSAMGAFQHMPSINNVNTLKQRWEAAGLNWKTDKFTPENQVKMTWHFIKSIYPGVEQDLAAGNLRKVMSRLRGTWPSIPGGSQENAHSAGFEDRYYGYLKSLHSMGVLL